MAIYKKGDTIQKYTREKITAVEDMANNVI
jgi:hypothetical protein